MTWASAEGFTVRVLVKGSDRTAGVGFLVTDRHIVTCAHVVNVALGRDRYEQGEPGDGARIQVEFPKLAEADDTPSRNCRVDAWKPPSRTGASGDDIAGLTLLAKGDLPETRGRPGCSTRRCPAGRWSTCSVTRETRPGGKTGPTAA
jgi:hypothetical protein